MAPLALPWLEAFPLMHRPVAHAAADGAPKRLVVFFWPGGTIIDKWRPAGDETTFSLSPILEPLAPYRSQLVVLDGLTMSCGKGGFGHPHQRGLGGVLTNRTLPRGTFDYFTDPGQAPDFPDGASLDQVIGARVGSALKFKSLQLGVQWPSGSWGTSPQTILSYTGPRQPSPPMADPQAAFHRVFADFKGAGTPPPPSTVDTRRRRTKLVLEAAAREFDLLGAKLGAEDRKRLDEHQTHFQEMGRALDAADTPMASISAACEKPELGAAYDHRLDTNAPKTTKLMMDLATMALACDQTRVVTLQYTDSASRNSFPFLGLHEGHHFYQHDAGSVQVPQMVTITRWFMEQLAYLCGRLSQIKEGDRTMLDNTVILSCTEIAHPQRHDFENMPLLLVGGAGGSFRTGRVLRTSGPHGNLLVSLMNAFGIEGATFGDPKFCTGPLAGLA